MSEAAAVEPTPAIGSPGWVESYGLSSRVVCRKAQLEIAHRDDRVVSLEGDLGLPDVPFHRELPERYLQIGISEADLVSTAVGMARRGKVPFVNSFAAFLSMRACEQIRLDVAYHRSNVKLMAYYAGTSGGFAGGTHHCIEDLAILRSMPGMVVISPADAVETYKATWAALRHEGPVYLRLSRAATPQVYHQDYPFEIGRAVRLLDGDDLTLIATGTQMVPEVLAAAERLREEGVACRVLNIHTIKPLDRAAIVAAAAETGAIVTLEDHNLIGGLGTAVSEVVLEEHPVPVIRLGIEDRFCESLADYEEMLPMYGIDAEAVVEAARRALEIKGRR